MIITVVKVVYTPIDYQMIKDWFRVIILDITYIILQKSCRCKKETFHKNNCNNLQTLVKFSQM